MFGVWARGEEVAKLTYFGLYALQHRGQEAAGIAVSDGTGVVVYKDLGLVAQVFDEPTLASLRGHIAVGHTRYSTTGASNWENAQPTLRATPFGSGADRPATTIALAHNGNLVNTAELAKQVADLGLVDDATSDTALVTSLLAARPDLSVEAAALEVLPTLRGAFSFVFMDEETLYAARDPQGVRPLVLGRLERGWVVASETAALETVGASFVREVEPGELIAIGEDGLRSTRFASPDPKGCLFEYVYLARPDSVIAGRNVYAARVAVGKALAREHPVEADLVIGVPESGHPGRDRIRRGVRHPVQRRAGQERLRRPYLHPAQPEHPPARHPAEAQPAARGGTRQAGRDGRRLDRARQHPAGSGPAAARGRRDRDPCPDLLAAGDVAVLLRHRLRHPGRAHRQRARHRGHPAVDRRGLSRLRLAGRADRRDRAAQDPALPSLLRR